MRHGRPLGLGKQLLKVLPFGSFHALKVLKRARIKQRRPGIRSAGPEGKEGSQACDRAGVGTARCPCGPRPSVFQEPVKKAKKNAQEKDNHEVLCRAVAVAKLRVTPRGMTLVISIFGQLMTFIFHLQGLGATTPVLFNIFYTQVLCLSHSCQDAQSASSGFWSLGEEPKTVRFVLKKVYFDEIKACGGT